MSRFAQVLTVALVVVPGPDDTVTFVRQRRGPYAGNWLLPGGGVEVGETAEEAARREVAEETGCRVGRLDLFAVYELMGEWAEGRYHLVIFGFSAGGPHIRPAGFAGADVDDVVQRRPQDIVLHSTDMQILTDAGITSFAPADIERALLADRIAMTSNVVATKSRATR